MFNKQNYCRTEKFRDWRSFNKLAAAYFRELAVARKETDEKFNARGKKNFALRN